MTTNKAPLRDAATVILVRDAASGGDAGIEVFMLKRNVRSDFNAGAYVFPGGAVDSGDLDPRLIAICEGLHDGQASHRLGVAGGGLAFWIAAIRECFEEAGLLLATDAGGWPIDLLAEPLAGRFADHRQALNDGAANFADICLVEQLRLPLEQVYYYSHWITPEGMPKRYNTRFFACAAPPRQPGLHDGQETVEHCWITPKQALRRHAQGSFPLVPATRKQIESLLPWTDVAAFMAAVASVPKVPTILPVIQWDEHGRPAGVRIPLPGGMEEVDLKGMVL